MLLQAAIVGAALATSVVAHEAKDPPVSVTHEQRLENVGCDLSTGQMSRLPHNVDSGWKARQEKKYGVQCFVAYGLNLTEADRLADAT